MFNPKLKLQLVLLEHLLLTYSCNLVWEENLTEAIKKDEVNLFKHSSLKIKGESDVECANRVLSIAKNRRLHRNTLQSLRKSMKDLEPQLIKHLCVLPNKRISYILKRDGYKNRKCIFEILLNGEMNAYLNP
jgi:hypothetical protein